MRNDEVQRLNKKADELRPAAERESPAVVRWAATIARRNYVFILSFSRRTVVLLGVLVVAWLIGGGVSLVLVVKQGALAKINCRNIATLARIERGFITRQAEQQQALLTHGIIFGIPKAQLPALIESSKKSQAQFLTELDTLTNRNCAVSSPERRQAALTVPKPRGALVAPLAVAPKAKLSTPSAAPASSPPAARSPRASSRPAPHAAPAPTATSPSPPSTTATALTPPAPTVTTPASTSPSEPPTPTVPTLPKVPCVRVPPLNTC